TFSQKTVLQDALCAREDNHDASAILCCCFALAKICCIDPKLMLVFLDIFGMLICQFLYTNFFTLETFSLNRLELGRTAARITFTVIRLGLEAITLDKNCRTCHSVVT